jgi:hypothetical protein
LAGRTNSSVRRFALRAVGASVPATGLLLVYALGQVVQSLPLLPGGGGTVEASLALGFAAFGHTSGPVVAGVLLYRVINTWGLDPIGWGGHPRQRETPARSLRSFRLKRSTEMPDSDGNPLGLATLRTAVSVGQCDSLTVELETSSAIRRVDLSCEIRARPIRRTSCEGW